MIYKYSENIYINTDHISEFIYDDDSERYYIVLDTRNKYPVDKQEFYKLMNNIRYQDE